MLNTTLCNQFAKKLAGKLCALSLPLLLFFASSLVFSNNILSQTANNPEQGANGSALAPHAVTFQNGNLHSGNAHFLEGHSIPYHLVMTGLTPGAQYIIKIGMDALESGAAAIDYVTSIHNLTPHTFFGHPAELINPLEGTGFTEGSFGGAGNIQAIPLPAPVHSPPAVGINTFFGAGTWNNLAAEKKSILLFGASAFGSVKYDAGLFDYTLINTGNVTKPIYLTIHFTAATANAVLAWGGHISSQLDYGLNTTAATEVNGAPYHTRRSGMWNGDSTVIYANEGADRSLQIDAITVCVVTAGEIGGSQTVCSGGDPALLTNVQSAQTTGVLTYQWLSSATGCSGPWSAITGATDSTYNPPAGITATTYYKRVAYSDAECNDTSNCVTVTVNTVTAGEIAASQTICSGDDPAAFTQTVAATGSGTPTYQWQSKLGNCTGVFSNIVGATNATYDAPALTATTSFRRIVTFTFNSVECKDTSNCVTVTVNTVTAGTIASSQTICSGDDPAAFTETVAATGDGTPTYQWQSKLGNCTGAFSNIVGATSATYDAPALTATTSYRRIVTFTLSGVECKDTSNCVTITVNTVTAGTIAASQTICSGDDPAAFTESVAATGDGTPTYQWQSKLGNCTGVFSNIVGATSATYDAPALTATTSYRRIVTFTLNDVECKDTSNCVTITVNTVTAGTIAAGQTICSGGDPAAFTETVAATGDGTPTYQWQSKLGNCTGVFSNIVGATSATYDVPAGLTATTSYRRIVTFTLSGVECKDTSNCVTITVNTVTAGTIAANQTICTGEDPAAFTETTAATGDGTPTYQWQSKLGNCTGAFTDIVGATSATYDAPALNATTSYRRIVTFTLSGVECKDTSNCVTVTVQDCLDHIFPTGTTCDNFEDQNVAPLLSLCFKESGGVVTTANSPGAWFYFFYVTKPAGVSKITVKVTQSNDNVIQGLFTTSEIKAWTSSTCNQITKKVTTSFANPSSPVITIDGLSNSEQLIVISVKYNSGSIVGSTVTGNSSVYTFGALYGTGNNPPVNAVPGSGETLTAVNCSQNTIVTGRDISSETDIRITAYPNPFNRSVYFNFVSPVSGRASLDVYDVLGRRLATVFQGHVDAGIQKSVNYTVPSAHRVPMVYRLTVGDKISYGKLLPGSTE